MAYLPKAERRAALLDAAVALLWREGLSRVTTRAVAAEAGSASGILHHHFATAADLKREAFAMFAARDLGEIEQRIAGLEPLSSLAALIDELIPRTGNEPHWRVWREAWDEAQTDGAFAEAYLDAIEAVRARLTRALAAAAADADFDADGASWRLLALSDGLIGFTLMHGGGEAGGRGALSLDQAAALLRAAAEREVGRPLGERAGARA